MSCPLCGYVVTDPRQAVACSRCPLAAGCHLARCPRCGYEWAEESHVVNWLRRRWRTWRPSHEPS